MGAQIACEYALGGHDVEVVSRRPERVASSIDAAVAVARRHDLAPGEQLEAARRRIVGVARVESLSPDVAIAVESVPEHEAVKVDVLAGVARAVPGATVASNTSSLSITRLGAAIGAPERTLGTHYLNPPLLMPLVEIVRGEATTPERVDAAVAVLRDLGKRPVTVDRDVPGFVWNRLQFALLREAVWLVEQGIASPEAVDEVVRDGLARRWRLTGPFETVALGGPATFAAVAHNLLPELSNAGSIDVLEALGSRDDSRLDDLLARRDEALASELRAERRR